jgi:hypothetical protein
VKKIKVLVITGNKLTDNFLGLIKSGFRLDMSFGPPVAP